MRLRIDLAYDGGSYHGWARQPGLLTVQGQVEDGLHRVLRVTSASQNETLRLTVAGRTDVGVHASGQVCHLDLSEQVFESVCGHMEVPAVESLKLRLNHLLPKDISILRISEAPEGFDARFSALERTYVYRISDGDKPADPRLRGFVLSLDSRLDVDAMNESAEMIAGLHDFGSFSSPNPGGTTIREVKNATWSRIGNSTLVRQSEDRDGMAFSTPTLESGMLCFTIVADAFAHNMVRSLVNASVKVGRHKKTLDWFREKMEVPIREGSTGPIEPQGLTLEHVTYPPDHLLSIRSQSIRARRTL